MHSSRRKTQRDGTVTQKRRHRPLRLASQRARGHLRAVLPRLRSPPSPSLRVPGSAEPRPGGSGHIHAAPVSPLRRRRAPAATEHGAGGSRRVFPESQSRRGWKGPQEIIESSLPANQIPYNSSHRLTSINSRRGTENMVEDVYQLILVTKTPHFVEIVELRQVISVTFLKK
ncbi:uncharacterized protein LOC101751895 [Gallus gallus]|uniref:uncharacterized protein LOC101751895 n=1 Tax=Gallus gallus TaxID=9031 RepID=UPI001EFFCFF2|nr:uncharacterized protein LOC101751895 [Gallus gallus]